LKISEFKFESKDDILTFVGWTDSEKLVCVTRYGTINLYNLKGYFLSEFKISNNVEYKGCKIWGEGMVMKTKNNKLIYITSFDDPKPKSLVMPNTEEEVSAWEVIPPRYTISGVPEVIMSIGNTIYVCDNEKAQDQKLENGPFTSFAVDPIGKNIASFTTKGVLWVVSTDFSINYLELDVGCSEPPTKMAWCRDLIVMYWEILGLLILVNLHGDWINYSYASPIIIVQELDGIRILSKKQCQFISPVSKYTESIFSIGATTPAAMLYGKKIVFFLSFLSFF
jgi:vacuolar protein sorting-associated protein 16